LTIGFREKIENHDHVVALDTVSRLNRLRLERLKELVADLLYCSVPRRQSPTRRPSTSDEKSRRYSFAFDG
jgi:hypothetical protein